MGKEEGFRVRCQTKVAEGVAGTGLGEEDPERNRSEVSSSDRLIDLNENREPECDDNKTRQEELGKEQ